MNKLNATDGQTKLVRAEALAKIKISSDDRGSAIVAELLLLLFCIFVNCR